MMDFKIHMGSNSVNMDSLKNKKPSFISNNNNSQGKKKNIIMKKVNTRIPKTVLKSFELYCVQQGEFRKTIFNQMLKQFLENQKVLPFSINTNIHNLEIDFSDVEEANFEFEDILFKDVQEFKIENRLSLSKIYTQVILHFLESNREQ